MEFVMNSPSPKQGFLSSVGTERTVIALFAGLAIIVFLLLDVLGKDNPVETKPAVRQSNSTGDIGGLNLSGN
jgi:hypothetical protein